MGRPLQDLSFEEWVIFVFDHPVDEMKLEWYWDINADWWDGPAELTVEYLTRAFENAENEFQPYTDNQLNQGLWYIDSNACSNHILALTETSVPWKARQRCIASIYTLYEQCFGRHCTPHLSHLDEPGAGPLNSVCYMWWDIIPLAARSEDPNQRNTDEEILRVMDSTLQLDSIACCESALHGLGHWQLSYPKQVTKIIDLFLKDREGLRSELQTYAMNAARGCIL